MLPRASTEGTILQRDVLATPRLTTPLASFGWLIAHARVAKFGKAAVLGTVGPEGS